MNEASKNFLADIIAVLLSIFIPGAVILGILIFM